MDINKKVGEFKESFRNGGILTKILLVFGFLFTLSSIASLSGVIIEWKGFILEGLKFYQSFFVSTFPRS